MAIFDHAKKNFSVKGRKNPTKPGKFCKTQFEGQARNQGLAGRAFDEHVKNKGC
jgi:hypothetical protein